jgi:hypothetical protein
MRYILVLTVSTLAWAQSATTTYQTDINGARVAGVSSVSTDGEKTQITQSINGRQVPVEQSVEKILREDANGKVVERTVKRFNGNGQLASSERVVTEETKLPGGGSNVKATTYRSDLNGNMTEAERKTIETRVQGSTTNTETVIEQPSINGSFATAEKRSSVTQTSDGSQNTTESVYRADNSGGFQEALRYVTTVTKKGDQTTENQAAYEPGVTGQMQQYAQRVSVTTKHADGSESTEVDLYANSVAGRVQAPGAAERIKERQLIERRTLPDGSVVETLSVRRPSISDPNRLGDPQQISETVCTGKCAPDKTTPQEAAATPTPASGNSRP